jgi:hypothetical protein
LFIAKEKSNNKFDPTKGSKNNKENASRQGSTPGIITKCVAVLPLSTHFVW